jgi:hypothetical protein
MVEGVESPRSKGVFAWIETIRLMPVGSLRMKSLCVGTTHPQQDEILRRGAVR